MDLTGDPDISALWARYKNEYGEDAALVLRGTLRLACYVESRFSRTVVRAIDTCVLEYTYAEYARRTGNYYPTRGTINERLDRIFGGDVASTLCDPDGPDIDSP